MTTPLQMIPVRRIFAWEDNPRRSADPAGIDELAAAIAAQGLLENLIVRPYRGITPEPEPYEVIAGNRRLAACKKLIANGVRPDDWAVPCHVRDMDDPEAIRLALVENLQREDMPPLQEAEAFAVLRGAGDSTAEIASAIGKSQRHVQLRLNLVDRLAPETKQALADDKIRCVGWLTS